MRPDLTDLDPTDGETTAEYLRRVLPAEWFETDATYRTARLIVLCQDNLVVAKYLARDFWRAPMLTFEELLGNVGLTFELELAEGYEGWLDLRVRALRPEGKRLFAVLGLTFGRTVDREALESVFGEGLGDALNDLRDHALIDMGRPSEEEDVTSGRRARARKRIVLSPEVAERAVQAAQEFSVEEREAALARFVRYGAEGAILAAEHIVFRWNLARPDENTDLSLPALGTVDEARDWMRSNSEFLAGCVAWARSRGMHETACRIVESAEAYLRENGEVDALVGLLRAGLDSSRALGDTVWQARMHNLLGLALLTGVRTTGAESLDEADGEFAASYALADADGDDRGRAAALECRGLVALADDRNEDALALFTRVRPLKEEMGRPRGIAVLDLLVGRTLTNLGRFDHALEYLDAAQEFFAAPGDGPPVDEVNMAKVRYERGRVLVHKRKWLEARRELDLALVGFAARGLAYQMAQVREAMAGYAKLTGSQDWQTHIVEAERLYRENGNEAKAKKLRTYLK